MDPGLVDLQVDRDHGGNRTDREAGFHQAVLRQLGDLVGGTAALAADAEGQHRRVIDQAIFGDGRAISDDDVQIAVCRPFDCACTEPIGATRFLDERDGAAGEQRGHG